MYIFENTNIFSHLKLEIALPNPASNDEKKNWINSAGQWLSAEYDCVLFLFIFLAEKYLYYWEQNECLKIKICKCFN